MFDENYDEGYYCEECDQSYTSDDYVIDQIDEWSERYGCPHCGHFEPRLYATDYFIAFGFYLLSVADDDYVFPGEYRRLPAYEE